MSSNNNNKREFPPHPTPPRVDSFSLGGAGVATSQFPIQRCQIYGIDEFKR